MRLIGPKSIGVCARSAVAVWWILAGVLTSAQDDGTITEWLAHEGFVPGRYSILFQWQEQGNSIADGLVTGVRLEPVNAAARDLYFDTSGRLLPYDEQIARGIWPKRWTYTHAEAFGERAEYGPPAATAKVTPQALSALQPIGAASAMQLPPLDRAWVEYEDAVRAEEGDKSTMRAGVFQNLPEPVYVAEDFATHGLWETAHDGARIWSLSIEAPEARGQRLHFTELVLPAGCEVVIYNAADPSEIYGPFSGAFDGTAGWWSPTCFGETVVVECRVSPDADSTGLIIGLNQIIHVYADLDTYVYEKNAGACNLDVTCHPAYAATSRGVVALGTIGTGGFLFCTGTLIADLDHTTEIPFVLTAHHCISTQDKASTTEAYWLYQTAVCNGAPPNLASVPRSSSGADFLVGSHVSSGTDVSLIRLRDTPPPSATFAGWSTAPWPVGTAITGIHHPRGSFKRISFGPITNQGSPSTGNRLGRPIERYHEIIWTQGTTEPASSGSPIVLQDTQQIIGQLWGGLASCSLLTEPDYYGRFDVSFPLLAFHIGSAQFHPADVDRSGVVDAIDLQIVINVVLGVVAKFPEADVDGSGTHDSVDIQTVILAIIDAAAP